jgi:DNA-binding XRE family transcriptional regulator
MTSILDWPPVLTMLYAVITTYAELLSMSTGMDTMITPEQCRMARAALQMTVRSLAERAEISAMTVTRFENGHSRGYADTNSRLQSVLEAAGVEFIPENGGGAGVRLKKPTASTERG